MHEHVKWHDACSNAVQSSPKGSNSQNWLKHWGINTKTPKFGKPLDQFEKYWRIDHHTW